MKRAKSRAMFSKFTSMFHNAVEALAPTVPAEQDFAGHWHQITSYFVENKDHKVCVDQTQVPQHLGCMLQMLVEEEGAGSDSPSTGPCMEYFLQFRIMETLYTLARTDCPPGMRQIVLQFYTKLLSRIKQPLLPHVNVHRPVQRLVKLCGETQATPTEVEEVQLVTTICAKLKEDPYLVNFFIQTTKPGSQLSGSPQRSTPHFTVVESLLSLMESPDARVAVKACEGLILCASLQEAAAAQCILQHTAFIPLLSAKLCALYDNLPKVMDPADVECVHAKWGLDVLSQSEDHTHFPGKRKLISFLSWLDYCDQLMSLAHPDVAKGLARTITAEFLHQRIQPALLQACETSATTATAHLYGCLQLVSSSTFLDELVTFLVGKDTAPDRPDDAVTDGNRVKLRLIERCNHLSDELSITTLKLFEVLLQKSHPQVVQVLLLKNMSPRPSIGSSVQADKGVPQEVGATQAKTEAQDKGVPQEIDATQNNTVAQDKGVPQKVGATQDHGEAQEQDRTQDKGVGQERDVIPDGGVAPDMNTPRQDHGDQPLEGAVNTHLTHLHGDLLATEHGHGDANTTPRDVAMAMDLNVAKTTERPVDICEDVIDSRKTRGEQPANDLQNRNLDGSCEGQDDCFGDTADFAQSPFLDPEEDITVHKIVNSFLCMLPEEAKSSYQLGDTGYDTYLRDAHHQFTEFQVKFEGFQWPEGGATVTTASGECYEGHFLKVLLDRVAHILDQSYDVNLQLTCVMSRLALIPHPTLHELLLNPLAPHDPSRRTLPTVLRKVVTDMRRRIKTIPDFSKKVLLVRKQLMGFSNSYRKGTCSREPQGVENSTTLAGVIVLEEFCKELAAITFVKYHESAATL